MLKPKYIKIKLNAINNNLLYSFSFIKRINNYCDVESTTHITPYNHISVMWDLLQLVKPAFVFIRPERGQGLDSECPMLAFA